MVIMITTTWIPLLVLLPNLQVHILWVEAEVTIHALRRIRWGPFMPMLQNSMWEVLINLNILQIQREFNLHCRPLTMSQTRS